MCSGWYYTTIGKEVLTQIKIKKKYITLIFICESLSKHPYKAFSAIVRLFTYYVLPGILQEDINYKKKATDSQIK